MNLYLFTKLAIDMRATQNLSRQVRQSAGLNLLASRNMGKDIKSTSLGMKPTPKPLLSLNGPKPTTDTKNFPYFSPSNSAGQRNISNKNPSVAVNMPLKQ